MAEFATEVALPMKPMSGAVHPRSNPRLRRWLLWAALLVIALFVLQTLASWLVQREHVRQRLTARLEAAFGRSVEVEKYSFSFWGGPTLGAEGVTVGEDPRFGREYFLRADSLAVRLRWLSLLRGRFELGKLSLVGPTLNVESRAGDWNLAEWLGHSAAGDAGRAASPRPVAFVPRFQTIEVQDGRINFKRTDEKLPFALIGVSGTAFADGQGRWRLNVDATPWRAAESVQQTGVIHLSGTVGGTSSALRPANLQVAWTEASLPDFLRLVEGNDYGVRGTLALAANATTSGDVWAVEGHADLREIHRWDLALRQDNPSVSVSARLAVDLPHSRLQLNDAALEGPHSNLRGTGRIVWGGEAASSMSIGDPFTFDVASATLDFSDLASWLRAFGINVPEGVAVRGLAQAHGTVAGWPVRVVNVAVATSGAGVSGGTLQSPVNFGPMQLRYDRGALAFSPETITLAGAKNFGAGTFRIEMAGRTQGASGATPAGVHISGGAADAASLVAAANAFGWDVARGWRVEGPFHCDLRWPEFSWSASPWSSIGQPTGTMTLGGSGDDAASLRAPFLNSPVSGVQLRVDWKPGSRHVVLVAAQAFGARWGGTLDRNESSQEWQFALSANRLDASDLDRWLNPRWRESLIDRMLPFLNGSSQSSVLPEQVHAAGSLTLGEFSAAPFVFDNLQGNLRIDGRSVSFENVAGQLFGGKVSGSIEAQLTANPSYRARANFFGVDVKALAAGMGEDSPVFTGLASGQAQLSISGTARGDFASSLQCQGSADVRNAAWRSVGLLDSITAAKFVAGATSFSEASGQFSCASGAVALKDVVLATPRSQIDASGIIDFAQRLDLTMRAHPIADPVLVGPQPESPRAANQTVRVTGTLAAPEFSRTSPARRAR